MENEEKLLVNSALNASSFAIQHLVTKEYEKTEMHFHDCYECMLVHGGEAIFQIEGGSVTLLQNSLVLLEQIDCTVQYSGICSVHISDTRCI